jgi:hypothetical protein
MATLYSRTFWFPKAEWYESWVAHFTDLNNLGYTLQKRWGRTPGGGELVTVCLRRDYILEVTFRDLHDLSDDYLIWSVFQVLQVPPLTKTATALDVIERILQEPT